MSILSNSELLAAPIKNEGRGLVSVNGQILASACSIFTDDVHQEILFDTLTPRLLRDYSGLAEKKFSLRLTNCSMEKDALTDWKSVSVTFNGDIVPSEPSLFSVNGDAQGVALRIVNTSGEQAYPGLPMSHVALNKDGLQLNYRLQLVSDGKLFREGIWFGSIRFMVSYL
ncbi:fimbrial protein [Enterobacter sp. 22325]|uniref:fimbrial protein n=1 Tax=Enterobacter sp. 22325 TaxID=3453911 RepID=UPI003F85D04A